MYKTDKDGYIIIERTEKWKEVTHAFYNKKMHKLWLGQYKLYVSNLGRIKKVFNSGAEKITLGTANADSGGYQRYLISLCNNKGSYMFIPIHRLVAYAFLGVPEDDKMVPNHKDGDSLNNRASNLEWTTSGGNQKHAYKTGLKRIFKCEEHQGAKLTNKHVKDIVIPMLLDNKSDNEIADALNNITTSANINRIRRKKIWTELTIKYNFPDNNDRIITSARGNSKITTDDMDNIIIPMLLEGKGDTEISKILSNNSRIISRKTISKIRKKQSWSKYTNKYSFPESGHGIK